ncbi:MAG: RdgB/HAM1 family non-canonical purine NTP pyrophosphatase [Clostridiales bacterium]|nr:RdgB/HAM1 family non-canonical purine NTP pyrophosphatase [Clostridiales bacterium]
MLLVAATHNAHKLKEIDAITAPFGFTLIPKDDVGLADVDVEETGSTFEENSLLKAQEICRLSGKPAIADDSGLEVDFLNGAPGVHSARFAGDDCDDEANNRKLLQLLGDLPLEKRTGRFVSVVTLVYPDGTVLAARGEVEGHILFQKEGDGGFGYDPLFRPLGHDRSFGQFTAEEKNAISHRARALAALQEKLQAL